MANTNEILARAAALREETALNSISPERAGGIMYDTLIALNELWLQQGASLVISKIYASVEAMEADTAPISDLTGQEIRPGQIVVIASSDSDNGSVYRYNGSESPRWSQVGTIGNIDTVDSLDSDSASSPLAARQGKVLDGKISQLSRESAEQGEFLSINKANIKLSEARDLSDLEFEIGSLSATTGENTSATNRIRSIGFYNISNGRLVAFRVAAGYKVVFHCYDSTKTRLGSTNFLSNQNTTMTGAIPLFPNTVLVRFVIATSDDATITDELLEELPQNIFIYSVDGVFKPVEKYATKSGLAIDNTSLLISSGTGVFEIYPVTKNDFLFTSSSFTASQARIYKLGFLKSLPEANAIADDLVVLSGRNINQFYTVPDDGYFFVWRAYASSAYFSSVYVHKLYHGKDISAAIPRVRLQKMNIETEMGTIGNAGGDIAGLSSYTNAVSYMLCCLRTPRFLNVTDEDIIVGIDGIDTTAGQYFKIYCYGANFENLGSVQNTFNLILGTQYIKICFFTESYGTNPPETTWAGNESFSLSVYKAEELRTIFNDSDTTDEFSTYDKISFEVELPVDDNQQSASNAYIGNNGTRIWDNGLLYLPYNYKRDGAPVPLVIFMHGTGGFTWNVGYSYANYLRFMSRNGYAVADCSCFTSYYKTTYYGANRTTDDSKLSPLVISCYAGLYKFLTKKYNIRTDGVYLISKSAGGLVSTYLSYGAPFPVKCVADLAPSISMCGNSWRVTAVDALNFWLHNFGIDVDTRPVSAYLNGDGDRAFVLENIEKYWGFDPLFKNTDLNFRAVLTRMYSIEDPGGSGAWSQRLARAYMEDAELVAMLEAGKKYQPVPIKVWIAADDASVPISMVQIFQKMVRNGNGEFYIRQMPSGTGGHHSVDTDTNAPKTDYVCKSGETINIPVAYAEAVDWFNKY